MKQIIGIVAALGLVACGAGNESGTATAPQKAKLSKLGKEATQIVKLAFDDTYVQCGKAWTVRYTFDDRTFTYLQLANLDIKVEETELSSTDELNGIEFRGTVTFGGDVSVRSKERDLAWSPWASYIELTDRTNKVSTILKQNGEWQTNTALPYRVVEASGYSSGVYWRQINSDMYRPVECNTIPE